MSTHEKCGDKQPFTKQVVFGNIDSIVKRGNDRRPFLFIYR